MTRLLDEAVATVSRLPDDQQDELARILLQFTGLEQPPYLLAPEEHADLEEAEAEIARGELASEEEVKVMWAKYDL